MLGLDRFRHSANVATPISSQTDAGRFDWRREPVVAGHVRLTRTVNGVSKGVPIAAAPVCVAGVGVIYAGYDGRVSLRDPTLSKTYWTVSLEAPIYASVIALSSNDLLVVDTRGHCLRLDLKGRTVWRADLEAAVFATPVADELRSTLHVVAFGEKLLQLDLSTGEIIRTYALARPWYADIAPPVAVRNPYPGPTVTANGVVIACSGDRVEAFGADTSKLWDIRASAMIRATPAYDSVQDRALVVDVAGRWSLLDSGTGCEAFGGELDDKVTASPAISGDYAVIGTASGAVVALSLANGDVAWRRESGGPFDHTGFSSLPDGSVVCTQTRGNAVALCSRTGRFLWETSQAIGQSGYDSRMDTTPACGPDGRLYCGAYTGAAYAFVFDKVRQ